MSGDGAENRAGAQDDDLATRHRALTAEMLRIADSMSPEARETMLLLTLWQRAQEFGQNTNDFEGYQQLARYLGAFFTLGSVVDPSDVAAEGHAEVVRHLECATCQETRDQPSEERLAYCQQHRCGLRDLSQFRAMQDWVTETLEAFDDINQVSDEALGAFNAEVEVYGTAFSGFSRDERGYVVPSVGFVTLRGAVQATLQRELSRQMGATLHASMRGRAVAEVEGLARDALQEDKNWIAVNAAVHYEDVQSIYKVAQRFFNGDRQKAKRALSTFAKMDDPQ